MKFHSCRHLPQQIALQIFHLHPKVTESVSKDKDGIITITLNNLSIESAEEVEVQLANGVYKVVEARIVTNSDMHAHNTFEAPEEVTEKDFNDYEVKGVARPPCR